MNIKDRILSFFHNIRRNKKEIEEQSLVLRNLLKDIICIEELKLLYKIIGYTRDIIDGLGEYSHAYMQLLVWYEFYPNLAMSAVKKFVFLDKNVHPYGSWKDIKKFCQYCHEKGMHYDNPLIEYCLNLINEQLFIDGNSNNLNKSLAAKWVPREKPGKMYWMFEKLAFSYFFYYLNNTTNRKKAELKCKMNYRKLISRLNKELDTTQIKQCSGNWGSIDFSKITSLTLFKQSNSFLKPTSILINKDQIPIDRVICSDNLRKYINNVKKSIGEINSYHIELDQFVKKARHLIEMKNMCNTNVNSEIDLLNLQWRSNCYKNVSSLKPIIPIIYFSRNMSNEYLDSAIGISCRIADISNFGKRILYCSDTNEPIWHNLDNCDNFIEMVEQILNGSTKQSNNPSINKAVQLIAESIMESNLKEEEIANLKLAIFTNTNEENIIKIFEKEGIAVSPHLLFWNQPEPSKLCKEENVSFISGNNANLLNLFYEKTIKEPHTNTNEPHTTTKETHKKEKETPWNLFVKTLNNKRYNYLIV